MSQNVPQKQPPLSDKQLQALPYLAASGSMTDAATALDVSRRTLYRWMEDTKFKAEYDKLREQPGAVARAELRGLMLKAAATFADGMDDENPWVRLRAAQATINAGMKVDGVNENKRLIDLMSNVLAESIHDLER